MGTVQPLGHFSCMLGKLYLGKTEAVESSGLWMMYGGQPGPGENPASLNPSPFNSPIST